MRKTTKMVAVLAAMSVMVLGAATMVSAAEKQGWVKEGSDWYYYNNDKAIVNGWAQDSAGKWYFLGEEGKMEKEAFVDNDALLVVEDYDDLADDADFYYVNADGAMVTGWAEIETKEEAGPNKGNAKTWYYFDASGVMYSDEWALSNGKWYFLTIDGGMAKNYLTDDGKYYMDKDGVMITGWYKATDKDDDYDVTDKPNQIPGLNENDWIYAGSDGKLVTDSWKKINSSWYYFGEVTTGSIVGGNVTGGTGVAEYVMNEDTFIDVEDKFFHLKSSGAMSTGLIKITENRVSTHYFAKSNGELQKGLQTVSGRYYFFDENTYARNDDAKYVVELKDETKSVAVSTVDTDREAKDLIGTGVEGNEVVAVYKLTTGTKIK